VVRADDPRLRHRGRSASRPRHRGHLAFPSRARAEDGFDHAGQLHLPRHAALEPRLDRRGGRRHLRHHRRSSGGDYHRPIQGVLLLSAGTFIFFMVFRKFGWDWGAVRAARTAGEVTFTFDLWREESRKLAEKLWYMNYRFMAAAILVVTVDDGWSISSERSGSPRQMKLPGANDSIAFGSSSFGGATVTAGQDGRGGRRSTKRRRSMRSPRVASSCSASGTTAPPTTHGRPG
jgi:hypothetical protein